MKGKATITLTDAKTGEVLCRREEHNLVTNAINNIFDPCGYAMLHRFDISMLFSGGLPLWKNLIGGIMLLGNNVTEDADNILLGEDTVPVGTAGSEYSGDNIYRGTLNLNESYATENGYHFTWDFGTDKANGVIKCVALTSKAFGDAGFHSDADEEDGSFLIDPVYMGLTYSEPTAVFEYGQGQYLGTFEPRTHLFVELNSSGQLEFRRYKSIDPSAIRINDSVGFSGMTKLSEPISVTTVTPATEIFFDNRFFLDPEERVVYWFGATEEVSDTSMRVTYTGISVDTLQTVVTNSIVIPKNCENYFIGAVWRGHLYYLTPDGLCEFGMDGSLIAQYDAPFAESTLLFVLNGCLMSQSPNGHIYCYSWGETTSTALTMSQHAAPNVDIHAPYAAVSRRSSHMAGDSSRKIKAAASIISSYMATINNLSQPIEKTSAQTLKISYDITN
ncbi:MAG: hypothetical protein IJO91_11075 [Oscillospiraceae bacterium]|nr:hypothetical protein [Oscillospiraceae bacterium]